MDFPHSTALYSLLVISPPLLAALTLHEVAHARTACFFGDRTASQFGRFSINPFRHIDLLGTIMLPLGLYWLSDGRFVFAYLKPVPVNCNNLRKPKMHMGLVALAGPLANLLQALLWLLFANWLDGHAVAGKMGEMAGLWRQMAEIGVQINLFICAINLLPLPPLDGGRILISMVPDQFGRWLEKLEVCGLLIVFALTLMQATNIWSLYDFWVVPMTQMMTNLLHLINSLFFIES